MPPALRLSPALAVAIGLLCIVAMGQITVHPTSASLATLGPVKGVGNPHPRDMVQLTSAKVPTIQLAAGEDYEVFAVPAGRWLVLLPNHSQITAGTPFAVQTFGGNYGELYEGNGATLNFRATAGVQTSWNPSTSEAVPSGSLIGWTFAPGSRVVIRNQGSSTGSLQYNFFGYLVDN
jgi:hypothetical protein